MFRIKKLQLTLLLVLVARAIGGTTNSDVQVPGFGTLSVPPSLEVLNKITRPDLAQGNPKAFFIQQSGLSTGKRFALNTYARIIISVIDEENSPVGFLETKYEASNKEIQEADEVYREEIESQAGTIITKWFPMIIAQIGGYDAIRLHYIRKGNNNKGLDVEVVMYQIENYTASYIITTSWRVNERSRWQSDIQEAINSIKIKSRTPQNIDSGTMGRTEISAGNLNSKFERGIAKLLIFTIFILGYIGKRWLQIRKSSTISESESQKLKKSIRLCGSLVLGWCGIQLISAFILIEINGMVNFLAMFWIIIPTAYYGYVIYYSKLQEMYPFIMVLMVSFIFIYFNPIVWFAALGLESLRLTEIPISNYIVPVDRFGASTLTMIMGFLTLAAFFNSVMLSRANSD